MKADKHASSLCLVLAFLVLPKMSVVIPEIAVPAETKFGMLQELMKSNMKGLSFSDIRRQEVVRYLDNVATIADTDFKRKVDQRVNDMNIQLEARKQFEEEL